MPQIDGKTVFDGVAELYDEARPSYPEDLVADALAYADLPADGRILEIGCGPGKATVRFAKYGYQMLCVEPGPNLVAIAREKCKGYPVEFMVCSFEDCPLPENEFGLAFAASAFHWLEPSIAFLKIAQALKANGVLAILQNRQCGLGSGVCREMNELAYHVHAPEMERDYSGDEQARLDARNKILTDEIEGSGFFGEVTVKTYPFTKEYTTGQYLRLLETYSNHRVLPEDQKRALYQAIGEIIDRHGGRLTRQYVSTLFLARRKP